MRLVLSLRFDDETISKDAYDGEDEPLEPILLSFDIFDSGASYLKGFVSRQNMGSMHLKS